MMNTYWSSQKGTSMYVFQITKEFLKGTYWSIPVFQLIVDREKCIAQTMVL